MRKNISDDEARISCQTYDKKEKEFASEIRKQAGSSSQNDRIRCIHRNLTPECSDILWKIPGTQIIWRRAVLSGKRFQEHRESFFRFDLYRSGDDRHSSRAEESCCWQGASIFGAGVSNPAGRFSRSRRGRNFIKRLHGTGLPGKVFRSFTDVGQGGFRLGRSNLYRFRSGR